METKAVAFNLMWKFYRDIVADEEKAKHAALITVNEILKAGKDVDEFCDSFWNGVKTELNNLVFITELKIVNTQNSINYQKYESKTFN